MASRAQLDLEVQMKGADKATADMKGMSKQAGILDKAMSGLKGGIGALGGALTVAGGVAGVFAGAMLGAAKAAADEQVGIDRLNQTLANVIPNWDGNTAAVEAYISKTEKLAFADDELRDSLNALVMQTGDLAEAQNLQAVAMDLARAKNMDLETASKLVGKVDAENIGILARYGIQIDENATKEEALAIIREKTAGQAQTFADSAAGSMERAQNAIGNAVETIGGKILGMLEGPLAGLTAWLESPDFQAFADTVGTVLAGAFQVLMDVGTLLYNNVILPIFNFFSQAGTQEAIGGIASAIGQNLATSFNILKDAAGWVFDNIIKPIWDYFSRPEVQSAVMAIADAIGGALAGAFDILKTAGEFLWNNVLRPFFDWFGSAEVQNTIGTVAAAVGTTLADAFKIAGDVIKWVWDNVLVPVWNWLNTPEVKSVIEAIANVVGTVLKTAFDAVGETIKWVWENVLKPVWAFLEDSGIITALGNIAGTIKDVLVGAFNALLAAAKGAWDMMVAVWNWLTGVAPGEAATAGTDISTNLETNLIGGLKDIATSAKVQAGIISGNITQGMADAIKNTQGIPIASAVAMTQAVMQNIASEAGTRSPSSITYAIGQNIARGLANGISSLVGTVVNAARNLVNQAIAAARAAAGIESPSKVFYEIGGDLVVGLAYGITAHGQQVQDATLKMIDERVVNVARARINALFEKLPEDDVAAIKASGEAAGREWGYGFDPTVDLCDPIVEASAHAADCAGSGGAAAAQAWIDGFNDRMNSGEVNVGPYQSGAAYDPGGGGGGGPPRRAMAAGGAFWTTGPTNLLVGEAGREFVSVTPQGKMGPGGLHIGQVTIHAGMGANGAQIANDFLDQLRIQLRSAEMLSTGGGRVYG